MESFPEDAGSPQDALDLIEQAEVDTYFPAVDRHAPRQPTSVRIVVPIVGVVTLVFIMWVMGLQEWWSLPISALAFGLLAAAATAVDNRRRDDVRAKLPIPRHVWVKHFKASWPLMLAAGLFTPLVLWGGQEPRAVWVLVLIAIVYVVAMVAGALGVSRVKARSK